MGVQKKRRVLRAKSTPKKPKRGKKSEDELIFVKLKCYKCKAILEVRTSRDTLPLYTSELKKRYLCMVCRPDSYQLGKSINNK